MYEVDATQGSLGTPLREPAHREALAPETQVSRARVPSILATCGILNLSCEVLALINPRLIRRATCQKLS